MANRCLLYASDTIPTKDDNDPQLISIGEWNYDVPLCFKLLLTGNPQACYSSIWESDKPIAVAGDYASGLAMLESFLALIDIPELQPAIRECLDFLRDPSRQRRYFILEAGDVYYMSEEEPALQNTALIDSIYDADQDAMAFFSAIDDHREKDLSSLIYDSGLEAFADVLYWQFESSAPDATPSAPPPSEAKAAHEVSFEWTAVEKFTFKNLGIWRKIVVILLALSAVVVIGGYFDRAPNHTDDPRLFAIGTAVALLICGTTAWAIIKRHAASLVAMAMLSLLFKVYTLTIVILLLAYVSMREQQASAKLREKLG